MVASGTALFEPLVSNASHRNVSPVHPKASTLSPGKLTLSSQAGVGKHGTLTTISQEMLITPRRTHSTLLSPFSLGFASFPFPPV